MLAAEDGVSEQAGGSSGAPPVHGSGQFDRDFERLDVLGSGGFATVLKARHRIDGRVYAVKLVALPTDDQMSQRTLREVYALSRLSHPNIVRYFSAWIEGSSQEPSDSPSGADWLHGDSIYRRRPFDTIGSFSPPTEGEPSGGSQGSGGEASERTLFIQMEHCSMTLRDWIDSGGPGEAGEARVWGLFGQLVSGVAYCHHRGVVHRDLKPSNLFIHAGNTVLIGDFGLAVRVAATRAAQGSRLGMPKRGSKNDLAFEITTERTGIAGTPLYADPAADLEGWLDPLVDSYALGVVLFELFRPFGTVMERVQLLSRLHQMDVAQIQAELEGNELAASLVTRLVCPEQRLKAAELLALLPEDSELAEPLEQLRLRNRQLELELEQLRGDNKSKEQLIKAQEVSLEKLAEEADELRMDNHRKGQQVKMLEIKVARLQTKYESQEAE